MPAAARKDFADTTTLEVEVSMAITMDPGHDDDKDTRPDCDSCAGTGNLDIGDCEDGVTDTCPACNGTGKGPEEGINEFVPKRDAFTPND
jgi:DnaJ-class molecular chaperone